jgi:hypothetical protein
VNGLGTEQEGLLPSGVGRYLELAAYLERGSDAHSGFGDFDDCDGFDGGACSGPDFMTRPIRPTMFGRIGAIVRRVTSDDQADPQNAQRRLAEYDRPAALV